jgi:hypothetical protein
VSLANAPVGGVMGQLKTLSEGAPEGEATEGEATAEAPASEG